MSLCCQERTQCQVRLAITKRDLQLAWLQSPATAILYMEDFQDVAAKSLSEGSETAVKARELRCSAYLAVESRAKRARRSRVARANLCSR